MSGAPRFRDFQARFFVWDWFWIASKRAMVVGNIEWERPEPSESAASILLFGLFKTPRVCVAAVGHAGQACSVGTLAPILTNV